ncbi:MAG: isoprenylcysteine carboxylmethyltransferase family protein [Aureispira sp.]|nr:isoprenylcysteine carboxylmethyltransferase family protein [Aureispira sp.]
MLKRSLILFYAIVSYILFLIANLYFECFLGNIYIQNSLDSSPKTDWSTALAINIGLILLFSIPHSLMARQSFKNIYVRFFPKSTERTTYILVAAIFLVLLTYFWQPIGPYIWRVEWSIGRILIHIVFGLGLLIMLISTFLIDHFELFGIKQAYYQWAQKPMPTNENFQTPFLYKYVRHPMMTGVLLNIWATPDMTVAHLVLALGFSIYIIIGTNIEEKDLEKVLGEEYKNYQKETPKLVPKLGRRT